MRGHPKIERACWCGATTAELVGRFEVDQALVHCDGCGVLALHPQPSDEQLAAAYSSEYYGSSPRKFTAPIAAVIGLFQGGRARFAAKQLAPGARILDVGCGNGGFLVQMQRRGFAVEGTEWTADAAARVPHDSTFPIHVGDLIDLDLRPASFDAITLWHVFEHVRRPRETLAKIRTLLRPGGVLLMSMPNAESAQARRFRAHWFHHDPPRHVFGFGPHSITRLLDDTGFRIAADGISTWSFEQNPFGEIQSELNRRQVEAGGESAARDRLYCQLKGLLHDSLMTRIADLARGAMLAPGALVRDILDSSRGEGATMTIEARVR